LFKDNQDLVITRTFANTFLLRHAIVKNHLRKKEIGNDSDSEQMCYSSDVDLYPCLCHVLEDSLRTNFQSVVLVLAGPVLESP